MATGDIPCSAPSSSGSEGEGEGEGGGEAEACGGSRGSSQIGFGGGAELTGWVDRLWAASDGLTGERHELGSKYELGSFSNLKHLVIRP